MQYRKMALNIYQIQPRLVFSAGGKVYKFFNISDECRFEVKSIMSSPMTSSFDTESNYTMTLVDIISSDDFHYVMKTAKGENLVTSYNDQYYYLAGRWLNSFHSSSYNEKDGSVFLFGDYVASHLYVDIENKEITVIDPGINFGKIGQIEEDVSRFIVGLFQTRDCNIANLKQRLFEFIDGYGVSDLTYEVLDSFVKFRINRSFEKAINLDTGLKRYFSAYFWLVISIIKHHVIKKHLRIILYGN